MRYDTLSVDCVVHEHNSPTNMFMHFSMQSYRCYATNIYLSSVVLSTRIGGQICWLHFCISVGRYVCP